LDKLLVPENKIKEKFKRYFDDKNSLKKLKIPKKVS